MISTRGAATIVAFGKKLWRTMPSGVPGGDRWVDLQAESAQHPESVDPLKEDLRIALGVWKAVRLDHHGHQAMYRFGLVAFDRTTVIDPVTTMTAASTALGAKTIYGIDD